MTNKLISVIMPVKNGTNYIKEAIDAIKKQNMNIEIIVVDDGSTDGTKDFVLAMGAKVIRHEESKGPVVAKNEALKVAQGEYIMFHDHDDIMNDSVLDVMYNELSNNDDIAAVMCKVKDFISPDTIETNNSKIKEDPYYGLFTGAVLIKKSAFDIIGLFKENVTAGEILDWQSRMDSNNQIVKKLDITATNRRIHNTNFGKTNQSTEFKDYAAILRDRLKSKQQGNTSDAKFAFAMTNLFRSNFFVNDRKKVSDEDHAENIKNLLKGLDEEEYERGFDLVQKLEKTYGKTFASVKDLYSKQELEQLEKVKEFENSIVKEDGYYRYQNYKLPVNIFESCVFLYKYGLKTLKRKDLLNNDKSKVILDVGGHIGDCVLILRDEFPENKIYSFEPTEINYKAALKTFELNNIENAEMINVGLGDKAETLKITAHDTLLKSCENFISEDGNEEINVITLDSYVQEHNLDVGLIKVDIEGFEQPFLHGARKTIESQKPILLLSIYHNYDDFYKIKPLVESWNLDYKFSFFQGVQNSGHIVVETLLIAEPKK